MDLTIRIADEQAADGEAVAAINGTDLATLCAGVVHNEAANWRALVGARVKDNLLAALERRPDLKAAVEAEAEKAEPVDAVESAVVAPGKG